MKIQSSNKSQYLDYIHAHKTRPMEIQSTSLQARVPIQNRNRSPIQSFSDPAQKDNPSIYASPVLHVDEVSRQKGIHTYTQSLTQRPTFGDKGGRKKQKFGVYIHLFGTLLRAMLDI